MQVEQKLFFPGQQGKRRNGGSDGNQVWSVMTITENKRAGEIVEIFMPVGSSVGVLLTWETITSNISPIQGKESRMNKEWG